MRSFSKVLESESAVSVSSSLRRVDSSGHVLRLEVTLTIVPKPVQGGGGELVIQNIRRQTILDQIVEGEPWLRRPPEMVPRRQFRGTDGI